MQPVIVARGCGMNFCSFQFIVVITLLLVIVIFFKVVLITLLLVIGFLTLTFFKFVFMGIYLSSARAH